MVVFRFLFIGVLLDVDTKKKVYFRVIKSRISWTSGILFGDKNIVKDKSKCIVMKSIL